MLISWFRSIGFAAASSRQYGQTPYNPWGYTLAKHMLFDKIRDKLGLSECRFLAVSAAPISEDTLNFFTSLDMEIHDVLGQSEGTAPLSFNTDTEQQWKLYTSGRVMRGVEVKTDPDTNEVMFRGRIVMMGYMKQPEETAATIDKDGWLHSGDLARRDENGRYKITGRIKDIIITAGGKNVSPIPLEEEIAKCPIVEHCVVVGDQRPFIGALVTLDPESLALWLPADGLSTETPVDRLATNAAVREEIQQYVDKANATVSRAESVRKFAVLDTQFTQENKCLTPSLKVVRPAVNRVFADVIDNEIYNGKR